MGDAARAAKLGHVDAALTEGIAVVRDVRPAQCEAGHAGSTDAVVATVLHVDLVQVDGLGRGQVDAWPGRVLNGAARTVTRRAAIAGNGQPSVSRGRAGVVEGDAAAGAVRRDAHEGDTAGADGRVRDVRRRTRARVVRFARALHRHGAAAGGVEAGAERGGDGEAVARRVEVDRGPGIARQIDGGVALGAERRLAVEVDGTAV